MSRTYAKFGALLHEGWTKSSDPMVINCTWAEDGSPYQIKVPEQLRDLIIELQNRLSFMFTGADNLYRLYTDAADRLESVIGDVIN